jgi:hypothetical protein
MIQGTKESGIAADAETGAADWKCAHTELVRLAALRASLDWDEGRSLLAALRFGSHLKLGFGSFFEYVEHLFGYRPRFTQEKLRVAASRLTSKAAVNESKLARKSSPWPSAMRNTLAKPTTMSRACLQACGLLFFALGG